MSKIWHLNYNSTCLVSLTYVFLKHQNPIKCDNSGRVKYIIFLNDDYLLSKMLSKWKNIIQFWFLACHVPFTSPWRIQLSICRIILGTTNLDEGFKLIEMHAYYSKLIWWFELLDGLKIPHWLRFKLMWWQAMTWIIWTQR